MYNVWAYMYYNTLQNYINITINRTYEITEIVLLYFM